MTAEALLFDIDGTLVDSVDLHARAWEEAFEHFGRPIPYEKIRAQIGKGGDELLKALLPPDELQKRGEEIERWRSDLYKRKYLGQVRGFPRVRELFQELLRRKLRIALASSAKGDELSRYKKLAGIDDLIKTETSSDDAERSKPNPDIFAVALERLGRELRKDRVLVIGDSPWDAVAAGRLGVRTLGVLCGGFPEAELRKAGCVAIYRDPADLLARLDESPIVRS
ncbi:MAG TPA: HAD family hydrolase [Myxococcales bacterium]|jgi:HAD superfamily hydrolase (TIGR01549 family)|nr:HAD family hydrolase [Myxococcales bacterium]